MPAHGLSMEPAGLLGSFIWFARGTRSSRKTKLTRVPPTHPLQVLMGLTKAG